MSRAIGDFELKNNINLDMRDQAISNEPDLRKVNISSYERPSLSLAALGQSCSSSPTLVGQRGAIFRFGMRRPFRCDEQPRGTLLPQDVPLLCSNAYRLSVGNLPGGGVGVRSPSFDKRQSDYHCREASPPRCRDREHRQRECPGRHSTTPALRRISSFARPVPAVHLVRKSSQTHTILRMNDGKEKLTLERKGGRLGNESEVMENALARSAQLHRYLLLLR